MDPKDGAAAGVLEAANANGALTHGAAQAADDNQQPDNDANEQPGKQVNTVWKRSPSCQNPDNLTK